MGSHSQSSWRERIGDYRFTVLLASLLLLVLAPLVVSDQRSVVFRAGLFVVLLFGVLSVLDHRRARVVMVALGILAGLSQATTFLYGLEFFPQLRFGLIVAFFSFMAAIIVSDVLRAEVITWDRIQGAICAYLLFGVAWGVLYGWVALVDPQAFSGAVGAAGSGEPMIYYSFVTLTTLGYGDITPVSYTARTLSWLEAAFGQIYLVVLVAHLVSRQLTHSSRDKQP